MTPITVHTEAELFDALQGSEKVRISGSGHYEDYRRPCPSGVQPLTVAFSGIIDYSPDDQVVVVRANTPIADLQQALMERGQCLPLVDYYDGFSPLNVPGTVAGSLMMSLPEYLEAEYGSWRDWVLGATVMMADGTIAKSGSRVVKNVAGYDVHKFLVGTRGTLAVLTEVVLRTTPLKSLPQPNVRILSAPVGVGGNAVWIQRVLPKDFVEAQKNGAELAGFDMPGTCTIFRWATEGDEFRRFPGDWVLRSGCGNRNVQIENPVIRRLMEKAKQEFDPLGKLNPGELL